MMIGAGLRSGATCGLALATVISVSVLPAGAQERAQERAQDAQAQVALPQVTQAQVMPAQVTPAQVVSTQVSPAQDTQCAAPREASSLQHLPIHFRDRIAKGLPLKIVAIGSSSTQGIGASAPSKSYPSRLEAELKARLPGLPITVLNKGIGGEEAPQMIARFEADVLDEAPDLVVWQVGSNSVLANHDAPSTLVHDGVERLKASGTDVILMNQQFAPRILDKGDLALHSVEAIAAAAHDTGVGLFNRFATMRYWHDSENMGFDRFVTADGVHMNDWGYGCIAKLLAAELLEGTKLPATTAKASAPPTTIK
jgi:acyl-CoA thioesterase I